jgi:hypothetical protein
MRKRCTPSQSLNDMPCQDISNFWDLIAPSQISNPFSLVHRVPPRRWFKLKSYGFQGFQIETGNSYMLFKVCIVFSEWLEYYMPTSSYAMTTVS